MNLAAFFKQHETSESTHTWTLISYDSSTSPIDALADCLADKIMASHLSGCPQYYDAWKKSSSGSAALTGTAHDAISVAFVKPIFGLPGEPANADHVQGFVSQYLWYFLIHECSAEEIVRVERPGFSALDHGGDGIVIHKIAHDYLMFRLWEIKKNSGTASISSTINTAYEQLSTRAMEYLARYTSIGQELQDTNLADFYSQLVEHWIEASREAAAGVSVAMDSDRTPSSCFTTFGTQFPRFVSPRRLKGMLTAIDDFSSFSEKVQAAIWKGL
jgi:hypothetical protein